MLVAPNVRKPSRLPTILMAVALAVAVSYFAFFRHRQGTPPAAPPVAAASVAAAAPRVQPPDPVAQAPAPDPAPDPAPEPKREVRKAVVPPPVPVVFTPPPGRSLKSEIDELIADGKWRDARAKVAAGFSAAIGDADRLELAQSGIRINRELLQERADEKDVELYEIQQGDTLESIAKKFRALNGVKGSIMYVNNYKENALLRAGRKVRLPKGSWSLIVDKSLFKMWVLYEGSPFKGYTITTGAPNKETPVTKFVVGGKNPKPAWWPPADVKISGKTPIPYGDPQNPLGDWWISLEHDLYHGIGIHDTNDPGSIGSKASNGCIRMLNEEVVEVAALAFKGMVVQIVE
ncbi:MAG TPA: L,D-transpeptidase family protein [Planctomycetota bacterium]|nr:L,D-transpeptidase family protein [Planctomycetota bacterium]